MEFINVTHIFHDPSVKACLPFNIKFGYPTVLYSLTIRCKIFNFNKFASNLDVKAFLQDNAILPCNCAVSRFIEKGQQHIVTGDLPIAGNNKLKKLLTKGPKYRETNNIYWEKAKSTEISDCIHTRCNKHGRDKSVLMQWKGKVIDKVDEK